MKQLFLFFCVLYITGLCLFPENLSTLITINTYFFPLFFFLESEFTTTENSYCCFLLPLHIISNCSGFYEVISVLSHHTWDCISKICDRCAGVCSSVCVFGHHETPFHACFLSITRTYGIEKSGASLHTTLSRSDVLIPKIISIQICLLKKKGNKVKLNTANVVFRMVFGGSVSIKLMKIIWTDMNYFRTQLYRFRKSFSKWK